MGGGGAVTGSRSDRSRSGQGDPSGASENDALGVPSDKAGNTASASGAAPANNDTEALRTQISFLEDEIVTLRRRLTDSPRHVRILEDRLAAVQAQLSSVVGQNEKLASTLREARDQILSLKEEVDRLAQPPSGYGVFLEAFPDEGTADVFTQGRKMRVAVSPAVGLSELPRRQEGMLKQAPHVGPAPALERHGQGPPLQ